MRFRVAVVGATGPGPNKCRKCTVDAVVIVEPQHAEIARVAVNKLRLKVKDYRRVCLTLKTTVREHSAGTVLPQEEDLSPYLTNDAIIAVSVQDLLPDNDAANARTSEAHADATAQLAACSLESNEDTTATFDTRSVEVLTMSDVLVLLSPLLSVRAFFRLSITCRSILEATCGYESGPWWKDACTHWSPLLNGIKEGAPALSWRDVFLSQAAEARRAWRDDDQYRLLVSVNTAPEPGLPRHAMSGTHLLPFSSELLQRVHDATNEQAGIQVSVANSVAAVRVRTVLEVAVSDGGVVQPGPRSQTALESDTVTLLLLRRRDGALLPLCAEPLFLRSSSGLTGERGASKHLRLVYELEPTLLARRAKGKGKGGRSRCVGAATWLHGGDPAFATGSATLALHYTLPVALPVAPLPVTPPSVALQSVTPPSEMAPPIAPPPAAMHPAGAAQGDTVGAEQATWQGSHSLASALSEPAGSTHASHASLHASLYAEPYLESIELLALPVRQYWDVEDLPPGSWVCSCPTVGRSIDPTSLPPSLLIEAIRASGKKLLAEAWEQPEVLAALLESYT